MSQQQSCCSFPFPAEITIVSFCYIIYLIWLFSIRLGIPRASRYSTGQHGRQRKPHMKQIRARDCQWSHSLRTFPCGPSQTCNLEIWRLWYGLLVLFQASVSGPHQEVSTVATAAACSTVARTFAADRHSIPGRFYVIGLLFRLSIIRNIVDQLKHESHVVL